MDSGGWLDFLCSFVRIPLHILQDPPIRYWHQSWGHQEEVTLWWRGGMARQWRQTRDGGQWGGGFGDRETLVVKTKKLPLHMVPQIADTLTTWTFIQTLLLCPQCSTLSSYVSIKVGQKYPVCALWDFLTAKACFHSFKSIENLFVLDLIKV